MEVTAPLLPPRRSTAFRYHPSMRLSATRSTPSANTACRASSERRFHGTVNTHCLVAMQPVMVAVPTLQPREAVGDIPTAQVRPELPLDVTGERTIVLRQLTDQPGEALGDDRAELGVPFPSFIGGPYARIAPRGAREPANRARYPAPTAGSATQSGMTSVL